MVQINFAQKQVNAKIVYYGPGMSGKTTNLEVIHQRAPENNRGDLTSISTDGDRTLFFDFMPLDLGTVAGMRTCFQIYTVPGQVYYNSTRKLVLQGVDGVVFVADSSASMQEENLESMRNLQQNLEEYGRNMDDIPLVIQYNKRDLPDAMATEELDAFLNPRGVPSYEAIANTGQGVFPTLKALAAEVLSSIHRQQRSGGAPARPQATAPQPAPAQDFAGAGAPQPSHLGGGDPGGLSIGGAPQPVGAGVGGDMPGASPLASGDLPGAADPLARTQVVPPPNMGAQSEPAQSAGLSLGKPIGREAAQPAAQQPQMGQPQTARPQMAQPQMAQPQMAQPKRAQQAVAVEQRAPAREPQTSQGHLMQPETSTAPQRERPARRSFPTRAGAQAQRQAVRATPVAKKSPKAAILTTVIVVASVGVGAALGSLVLSIF